MCVLASNHITIIIVTSVLLLLIVLLLLLEISDGADWQKRYCVLITEERRLYFFPDQDVSYQIICD